MRALPVLAAVTALLASAPAAHAGWFGGEVIDRGVSALGGVDLDRDGAGAAVYLKSGQVLLTRKVGGAWQAPEHVDAGLATQATEAVVAAGRSHRLVVAFLSGGSLYAAVAPEGPAPQAFGAPTLLQGGPGLSGLSLDVGTNGHAHVAYAAPGGGGADVRVLRLDRANAWTGAASPLDIDPGQEAGRGDARPRVATGADGHAVVVWGEGGQVWERRVIGTRVSTVPQSAGAGTLPDLDIEDDSSFVPVVWRDGPAAQWRRLVGSAFEPAVTVASRAAGAPDVVVDARGEGFAVAATEGGEVHGLPLAEGVTGERVRIDSSGGASAPGVATGEFGEVSVAWLTATDVRGRYGRQGEPFGPEAVLSRPDLPPPGAPAIAADHLGDAAVAMLQGDALVAADHDQPPGPPAGITTENWRDRGRPELRWNPAVEPWGPVTYEAVVDGTPVLSTAEPGGRPATRIPDGDHAWTVRAIDRRGQVAESEPRRLRVDATKPVPRLRIKGPRRPGALLRIRVAAMDATSGIKLTKLTLPDGSFTLRRVIRRRFGAGTHRLKLGVVDNAGNVARAITRLRIR